MKNIDSKNNMPITMNALLGDPSSAIPVEIRHFLKAILEGDMLQYVLVYENQNKIIVDDHCIFDDESANCYAMIGALECMKRDYMRMNTISRIEYKSQDD